MGPQRIAGVRILREIFGRYLYFLSEPAVAFLLETCHTATEGGNYWQEMQTLLAASAEELQELVVREEEDGEDEEEIFDALSVFLWKQKHGLIAPTARIAHDFENLGEAQCFHRFMVANGHQGIDMLPFRLHGGHMTTYRAEIDKYFGFFKEAVGAKDDNDLPYLVGTLNVIGPNIYQHERLAEIRELADYILLHLGDDPRLGWLDPTAFTLLVYDLGYPPERTWPTYRELVRRYQDCFQYLADYPALLVGIRMYGNLARNELRQIEIAGGFEWLDALARR